MPALINVIISKFVGNPGLLGIWGRSWMLRFAVAGLLMTQCVPVPAFETDQYNLPPIPLADIGAEVAEYTEDNIRVAIARINDEIMAGQRCLENPSGKRRGCGKDSSVRDRLEHLRSESAVVRGVYDRLGYGIIAFARAGTWMDKHDFRAQPARYKTSYGRSIFVYLPTDYFTISPTVNMYGVSLGTDKIAHFFQQGYTYYMIAKKATAKGAARDLAVRKAVNWGRMTELTYYGTLVGGVFSNADLFANYAGMKFYEGLTRSITIGGQTRQPTLVLKDGIWVFNETQRIEESPLKPFVSDHMNEALNPSLFVPFLRSSVRSIVRKQSCPQWRAAYPERKKEYYDAATRSLSSWYGEGYGFRQSDKFVTIGNTCFSGEPPTKDSVPQDKTP